MASREISLWIDERWYDALTKHLKDETLEEHLENVLDELCNQLPEHEYERISRLIWEEQEEHRMEAEAARRFAVFRVMEQGQSTYFVAEENIDTLQVANRLRVYTRKPPEQEPRTFLGLFTKGERISREQFDTYVCERLENTGRVVGAYDIDLDKGRFDALHITDGWQGFRVQDVSTAAYYAMKKSYTHWGERSYIFNERLDGKQLPDEPRPIYLIGARELRDGDISFAEEIVQNDHLLEFYMEVCFDADKVFGTNVCTTGNDDYLNVYAYYDMEKGCVADDLEVYLMRGDGSEQDYKYRLTDEEKAKLLPKMEAYCQQQWSQTLEQCRADYHEEQVQSTPEMQM